MGTQDRPPSWDRAHRTEYILSWEEARTLIPKLPWFYDEPFGDSSALPTMMVSRIAREEVKVALSADGGDELFGGYTSYALNPMRWWAIATKPLWLRKLAHISLSALPFPLLARGAQVAAQLSLEQPSRLSRRLIKLRSVLPESAPSSVFRASQSYFMPEEIGRLIGGYEDPRPPVEAYTGELQEQMTQWDFEHYLPDDILVKVDRATMSISLEGREPFLDHRLIEFAFRLPLTMRIGPLGQKHLLRKVLYRYVPRELVERPKHGFGIPLGKWLGAGQLEPISDEDCLQLGLNRKLVKQYLRKELVNEVHVWLFFILSIWKNKWFS